MKHHKILPWDSSETIKNIIKTLQNGGIALTSTDTVYGLLATITNNHKIGLNQIKNRPLTTPHLIMISSCEKITSFVDNTTLTPELTSFLRLCWPGPITIIFKSKKDLAPYATSDDGTIALRCPDHQGLLSVLKAFDGLFSTSANLHGEKLPMSFDDISPTILDQSQLFVDNKNQQSSFLASSILDASALQSLGTLRVVREGAFPLSTLEKLYGKPFCY